MNEERERKLNELIDECWAHHAWVKKNYPLIFPPVEIPILWFGNMEKYFASERKIVTVGLNPSDWEFYEEHGKKRKKKGQPSFHRFNPQVSCSNDIQGVLSNDRSLYRSVLDNYFTGYSSRSGHAYHDWFSHWDRLLEGLGASYDPERRTETIRYTAIHTDFCTPVATSPVWSKLTEKIDKDSVRRIQGNNEYLWHDLVAVLKPDLVLSCIAGSHIRKMAKQFGMNNPGKLYEPFCNRGKALLYYHISCPKQRCFIFAAPQVNYPWGGWCDLQIDNFAKYIRREVWGDEAVFVFWNRNEVEGAHE